MRYVFLSFILATIAIGAFSFSDLSSNLASVIMASDNDLTRCLERITDTQGNVLTKNTVEAVKTDVNNDGNPDRIIKRTDNASCGTAGCIHELCLLTEREVTIVPFSYAAKSIEREDSLNNGMYDLRLNSSITLTWSDGRYTPTE